MIQMTGMFHDRLDTRRFQVRKRSERPFVKGRGHMQTWLLVADNKGKDERVMARAQSLYHSPRSVHSAVTRIRASAISSITEDSLGLNSISGTGGLLGQLHLNRKSENAMQRMMFKKRIEKPVLQAFMASRDRGRKKREAGGVAIEVKEAPTPEQQIR